MKAGIYYILIGAMVLMAAACGGEKTNPPQATAKAPETVEAAPVEPAHELPEPEPEETGPRTLVLRPARLPADGRSVAVATVTGQGTKDAEFAWEVLDSDLNPLDGCLGVTLRDNRSIMLTAGFEPCRARVRAIGVDGLYEPLEAGLEVVQDYADSDADGFPDAMELRDPKDIDAFRAWFTAIADSQVDEMSPGWDPANRHCAGLIRFALIEALKVHNGEALKRYPNVERKVKFDVGKYNYPAVPILGAKILRTSPGPFSQADLENGAFADYVDARGLQEYNTFFLSRDLEQALPGDILFFLHFDDPEMPYHSMIFAGHSDELGPYLVYHTGPVDDTEGRMKRVPVSDLMAWPDDRWHPAPENPYFLGVYRFQFLDRSPTAPGRGE